ncbi:MAG TPA: hypothetical protein VGR12_02440 [Solirubrobacteraceae bacterium]|nr:hypothetical protein [Solirubrobacteraceae bacterium]
MRPHRPIVARLFWSTALALLAAAVFVTVQMTFTADGADPAPPPPPLCSELDLPEQIEDRVTCRTEHATLTIAGEGEPIVLENTQVRVLRSRLDRRTLVVRLRLRRETGTYQRPGAVRRQIYLRVGERRFWPVGGPRTDGTNRLRFPLPRKVARRLRRERARAELGIVAWESLGEERPSRLGVVRLTPRG